MYEQIDLIGLLKCEKIKPLLKVPACLVTIVIGDFRISLDWIE